MTRQQHRSLAKYISEIAVLMGLRDWTLNFKPDACDDPNALASVETVYGRKIANIQVSTDFTHYPPEMQRAAVVHELIHVHFAQERQAASDAFELLGNEAHTLAAAAYRQGHEYGVDALSDAIAPHYPLWVP